MPLPSAPPSPLLPTHLSGASTLCALGTHLVVFLGSFVSFFPLKHKWNDSHTRGHQTPQNSVCTIPGRRARAGAASPSETTQHSRGLLARCRLHHADGAFCFCPSFPCRPRSSCWGLRSFLVRRCSSSQGWCSRACGILKESPWSERLQAVSHTERTVQNTEQSSG